MLTPIFDNVPRDLELLQCWVVWRHKGTKKVPYCPKTCRPLNVTLSGAGKSLSQAKLALERGGFDGVGFILKKDALIGGVDMDRCIVNGVIDRSALALMARIGCTYVELSPSGQGLRGFGLVSQCQSGRVGEVDNINLELYTRARYLTFTGHRLKDFGGISTKLELMSGFAQMTHALSCPSADLTQAAQASQATHATQVPQVSQATHSTQEVKVRVLSTNFAETGSRPYPRACIPTRIGQRNQKLFHLARWLQCVMPDATQDQLYEEVGRWHAQFLEVIATKELGISWAEFQVAWENVCTPLGSILSEIERDLPELPDHLSCHRYGEVGTRLLRLCMGLARYHAPAPFFLSSRTAAEHIGLSHATAANLLKAFSISGYIELVTPGRRPLASTYRMQR